MNKRFTDALIIGSLREADAGVAVKDLCRNHGFSAHWVHSALAGLSTTSESIERSGNREPTARLYWN
jgi:hypothetical protein